MSSPLPRSRTRPASTTTRSALTLTAADNGCAGIDTTEYRIDARRVEELPGPGRRDRAPARTPSSTAAPTRSTTCRPTQATSFTIVAINDSAAPQSTLQVNGAAPLTSYDDVVALRLTAADPAGSGVASGVKTHRVHDQRRRADQARAGRSPAHGLAHAQRRLHDRVPLRRRRRQRRDDQAGEVQDRGRPGAAVLHEPPVRPLRRAVARPPVGDPAPGADRPAPAERPAVDRHPRTPAGTARMGHEGSARNRQERAAAEGARLRPVAHHHHHRHRRPDTLRRSGGGHRGRHRRLGVREPEQVQQVRPLPRQLQRPHLRGQAGAHRRRRQHAASRPRRLRPTGIWPRSRSASPSPRSTARSTASTRSTAGRAGRASATAPPPATSTARCASASSAAARST